jgi:type VI secretion system protein ImpF
MSNFAPAERLQPCLLDRLTDDEPDKKEESRAQQVISLQRYRRGVFRDLEWLFNTSAFLPYEVSNTINLEDYPEAFKSVINYGARQLCGLTAPDMDSLRRELTEVLLMFEPRVNPRTLTVRTYLERNIVTFEFDGELWAYPSPEPLNLRTSVDLETEQCVFGDSKSNG